MLRETLIGGFGWNRCCAPENGLDVLFPISWCWWMGCITGTRAYEEIQR